MTLEIVPIDFHNLELALNVAIEIFGEDDRASIEQEFKGSLGLLPERDTLTSDYKIGDLSLFIAFKDGKPAGVTGYYNIQGHEEDMWLEWTGVLPAYRGQGLGALLAQEAFNLAASQYDIRNFRIWSTLESDYASARGIYKKMGFIEEPYKHDATDAAKLVVVFTKSVDPEQKVISLWRHASYPLDCEQCVIPKLNAQIELGNKKQTHASPKKNRPSNDI